MKEPLWIRFFFVKGTRGGYYRFPERKESPWDILRSCIRTAMTFCDLLTLLIIGLLLGKVIDISLFQALLPIIAKVCMNLFISIVNSIVIRKKEEYDEKQYKEEAKTYKEYFDNVDEEEDE